MTSSRLLLLSAFAALLPSALVSTACDKEPRCDPATFEASDACTIPEARAGTPLRLQIREQCGSCGDNPERCDVTVAGTKVTLAINGQRCEHEGACPAICRVSTFDCTVPALTAGDYTVEGGFTDKKLRTLRVVTSSAAATSCTLIFP